MRSFQLTLGILCLVFFSFCVSAQEFTITQYDLGSDLNDSQLMQFAETSDGQIYFLYFYFDSGVRKHRLQTFNGTTWSPISRPCERCINDLFGGDDGQLYAATDDDIKRYDPVADAWSTYHDAPAFQLAAETEGTFTYISAAGAFDYDGTTATPRNNTGAPTIQQVRNAVYAPNGDLYVLTNTSLYRQNSAGWETLNDITSPRYLALAPDGKVYVSDNFGGVHYYEAQNYTGNVLDDVFDSFFAFDGFAINTDGVFWAALQGSSPSLVRHDPAVGGTQSIPVDNLIPNTPVLSEVFVASNNLVFVVSDFTTYVTTVDDGTVTGILDVPTPELAFTLAPNPTAGSVRLRWEELPTTGPGVLEVINTAGQLVRSKPLTNLSENGYCDLDSNALPSGSYWVVIRVGNHYGRRLMVVE